MDSKKSDALIDDLMDHITSEKYVYRHKWQPNDVIVWDNRCLLHSATTRTLPAYKVRRLLRITTLGTPVIAADFRAGKTQVVREEEFA